MATHRPGSVWLFWRKTKVSARRYRVQQGVVRTHDESSLAIELRYTDSRGDPRVADLILHRVDARMLAKRIIQCLEGTH